jgi:predicted DNA-binding protein (MmcQ/YjbR family)
VKNKDLFSFVVRYLGFLKYIPLLPHVFDSLLKLWVFVSKSYLLDWFDEIEEEVLSWEGTSASVHKYGGLQFNCRDKEMGHLHGNGLLDVLFNREIKQRLLDKGRIQPHHVFEKSGWTSFYIVNYHDKAYAKELLKAAYQRVTQGTN